MYLLLHLLGSRASTGSSTGHRRTALALTRTLPQRLHCRLHPDSPPERRNVLPPSPPSLACPFCGAQGNQTVLPTWVGCIPAVTTGVGLMFNCTP